MRLISLSKPIQEFWIGREGGVLTGRALHCFAEAAEDNVVLRRGRVLVT